jgi:hypothetical protein
MKAAAVLATLLLALAAAGCGGGSSKPTASDWADNLCSAVTSWTDELKSTATTLTSDPTLDGLKSAKSDVSSATDKFVDDLKGLGKPNTDAGEKAKETTDKLAEQLDQDKQDLNDAVDKASGVQGVVDAAKAVQTTLTTMASQFTAAFTSLQSLDTKGELEDAFQSADSCKKLAQSNS